MLSRVESEDYAQELLVACRLAHKEGSFRSFGALVSAVQQLTLPVIALAMALTMRATLLWFGWCSSSAHQSTKGQALQV